ncbi:MAG TPA: preprotein translocase subunit SecE [Oscillospiraceae bacterium]|nr:preprotein translocase subunit SecE [Oscillospiraceae bacterium]
MAEKQSNVAVAKKKLSPIRFFRESKAEFKKVVWPSRKQVINNTIVVIVTMIIVGLFIWGLDAVLGFLVKSVLQNQ